MISKALSRIYYEPDYDFGDALPHMYNNVGIADLPTTVKNHVFGRLTSLFRAIFPLVSGGIVRLRCECSGYTKRYDVDDCKSIEGVAELAFRNGWVAIWHSFNDKWILLYLGSAVGGNCADNVEIKIVEDDEFEDEEEEGNDFAHGMT